MPSKFLTVFQWRILRSLRSYEFLFAVISLLVLAVATGTFGVRRYEEKRSEFRAALDSGKRQIERARMYVEVMPVALLSPSPAAVLADGGGEQTASAAVLPGLFGAPRYWSVFTQHNPEIQSQTYVGFAPLAVVVLSLVGLLLSYGTFSSRADMSRLKLLLSFGVKRFTYISAVYCAITFLCFVPMIASTVVLVLVANLGGVGLSFFSSQVLGTLILGLLAVSASIWCGLFVSTLAPTARTALVIVVAIWIGCTWLWPRLCIGLGSALAGQASTNAGDPAPLQADLEIIESLPREPVGQTRWHSSLSATAVMSRFRYASPMAKELAELESTQSWLNNAMGLSFVSAFMQGAYAVCGTAPTVYLDFRNKCTETNEVLKNWHLARVHDEPDRCFTVTDRSADLKPVDFEAPIIYRASVDALHKSVGPTLFLVIWNLILAVGAYVTAERRAVAESA